MKYVYHVGGRGMVGDCRPRDIEIYQSPLGFNPADHVPQFLVHIMNSSPHGKALFDVHVDCGLFASSRLVVPTKFKRIRPGVCLVKNGTRMAPNEIITFRYSNSFPYKLVPTSVRCGWNLPIKLGSYKYQCCCSENDLGYLVLCIN